MPPAAPDCNDEALGLAGAVAARLCHDMAGTLGALQATLEMAAEAPDASAAALALSCARDLTARLRLYRAAWSRDGSPIDLPGLLPGLPNYARLSVEISPLAEAMEPDWRVLALNLLIVAASSLPRGGALRLIASPKSLVVEAAGPRIVWLQAQTPPGPRTAALTMARHIAAALGLTLVQTENALAATQSV